jgi:hypothetical protein
VVNSTTATDFLSFAKHVVSRLPPRAANTVCVVVQHRRDL